MKQDWHVSKYEHTHLLPDIEWQNKDGVSYNDLEKLQEALPLLFQQIENEYEIVLWETLKLNTARTLDGLAVSIRVKTVRSMSHPF